MQYPKIKYVEAISDYRLFIIFENGAIKIYSLKKLLNEPGFTALKDENLFFKVKKEKNGYGLIWNDEIDLSEYEVWKNGISVSSINKLTEKISG